MSKVVESGPTRCPRCARAADYAFIESDSNVTHYEVRCGGCGEVHSENSLSWALAVARDDEPVMQWPPDYEPVVARDWRQTAEAIGLRAQALAGRARAELNERLRGVRNS